LLITKKIEPTIKNIPTAIPIPKMIQSTVVETSRLCFFAMSLTNKFQNASPIENIKAIIPTIIPMAKTIHNSFDSLSFVIVSLITSFGFFD